jgi:N-acetylglutamate synthase-like GNAT family acetyltransferase
VKDSRSTFGRQVWPHGWEILSRRGSQVQILPVAPTNYVLEKENQIIAEYALLVLNDKEVEVKNIAVATEHQRRGIGKTLLKDATRRARYRCFKRVLMGTGDTSGMLYVFT